MKKILQINVVSNTGSTGRISEDIGYLMLKNGWQSYIAYGRKGNTSKSKLIKIGNKWDMYIHILISRLFDKHGFASTYATRKFIKKIKKINPDIIHLHNIHGYYINIEVLFKYLSSVKIPLVWTLHDCWALTGHCSHFEYIKCDKWIDGCFSCPQTNEYPKSFLVDNSKKNYSTKKYLFNSVDNLTVIPVSNWLNKIIKKSFLKNKTVKTIQNGIDLSVFNNKNRPILSKLDLHGKFVILGVASVWTRGKGFDDFCKFSELIGEGKVIVLVGLTKTQIETLPKNIIGIQRTESVEELAAFYTRANVYLNLTYADTFPTTNLEALACGTPVITYDTGGSVESISEETGFVIKKGDFTDLTNKIQIIKNNGKDYYTQKCISRAKKKYNKNDRYLEYLGLYNKLINTKHVQK